MNGYLLSLLQLSDPTLPIGGYAHSSGLETYVQKGLVHDAVTARHYVTAMLQQNLQYNDAAFASLAYDAAAAGDDAAILQLDQLCSAVKLPREMREASRKLGTRLGKIFSAVCESQAAFNYKKSVEEKHLAGHYCIFFGIYAWALMVPKEQALTGFLYNAAAGFVTNCVKLIPLGQQAGQELLFSLQPVIAGIVTSAMKPDPDLLGLSCPGFDIRCMQHEQLYSRLYMS